MTVVHGHVRHRNRIVNSPPGDSRIEYRDVVGSDEEATLMADKGTCGIRFDSSGRWLSLTDVGLETREAQTGWETLKCHEQPPDWKTLLCYRLEHGALVDVVEFVRR